MTKRYTDEEMADACRHAAKRIRENPAVHWTKDHFFRDVTAHRSDRAGESNVAACAIGNVALMLEPNLRVRTVADTRMLLVREMIRDAIPGQSGMPGGSVHDVMRYNDNPITTHEEVATLLDAIADRFNGLHTPLPWCTFP